MQDVKKNTLQTGLHSLCGSQSLHAPAQARVKVMKLTLSNHVSCIGCNTLATPTKHSWLLKHIALGYSVYPTITDCCRARFLMKVSRPTGCRPCVKIWSGDSSIELHVTYFVSEHRLGGQRSQVEPQQGTIPAVRNNEGNTLKPYWLQQSVMRVFICLNMHEWSALSTYTCVYHHTHHTQGNVLSLSLVGRALNSFTHDTI